MPQPTFNAPSLPFSKSFTFPKRKNIEEPKPQGDPYNNTNKKYFEPELLKMQMLENKIKDMEDENSKNKTDFQELIFNEFIRNQNNQNRLPIPNYGNSRGYYDNEKSQLQMNNSDQNPFKQTRDERRIQVKKELEETRNTLREELEGEEQREDESCSGSEIENKRKRKNQESEISEEESSEEVMTSRSRKRIPLKIPPSYRGGLPPKDDPNNLIPIKKPMIQYQNNKIDENNNSNKQMTPEEEAKEFINSIPKYVA